MDENADAAHRRHRLGIVVLAGLGALAVMAAVALVVALTGVARPPDDPVYPHSDRGNGDRITADRGRCGPMRGDLVAPVELLPPGSGSLARGVPDAVPGTLFVLGGRGGIRVEPRPRFPVVFGRNEPEVHVCVGEGDPRVSRRHGVLCYDRDRWTLRNTGSLPIRLPGSALLLAGHEEPLGAVYTPLFIRTGPDREHLVEVRVAGRPVVGNSAEPEDATTAPPVWQLTDDERLALVSLGQRYLRHEAHPRPETWAGVAAELAELRPGAGWTAKKAEWCVVGVRKRLATAGVRGLTREEVGEPVGNALNHNLVTELLVSTTIVPPDLRLLEA